MRLAAIKPEDLVRCDRLGRRFWALVTDREGRALSVAPVSRGVTYRRASSREVLEHYAQRPHRSGHVLTRSIRPGDMVAFVDDGASMFATVLGRQRARLRVRPVAPGAREHELPTRAVTQHYARRGRLRPEERR